ncbi:vegetative cell wall protein gp1-like isoform X2 [Venturia canescens]|uniref:vegetative cell wall protein gp1-like isoform X2 n=1 Tax=Venturia canescens TaxID=32260 RepID=UPI001C9D17BD|nr:vegetative cell wall protein gp1-like isoform X2 [Venturia canescens]
MSLKIYLLVLFVGFTVAAPAEKKAEDRGEDNAEVKEDKSQEVQADPPRVARQLGQLDNGFGSPLFNQANIEEGYAPQFNDAQNMFIDSTSLPVPSGPSWVWGIPIGGVGAEEIASGAYDPSTGDFNGEASFDGGFNGGGGAFGGDEGYGLLERPYEPTAGPIMMIPQPPAIDYIPYQPPAPIPAAAFPRPFGGGNALPLPPQSSARPRFPFNLFSRRFNENNVPSLPRTPAPAVTSFSQFPSDFGNADRPVSRLPGPVSPPTQYIAIQLPAPSGPAPANQIFGPPAPAAIPSFVPLQQAAPAPANQFSGPAVPPVPRFRPFQQPAPAPVNQFSGPAAAPAPQFLLFQQPAPAPVNQFSRPSAAPAPQFRPFQQPAPAPANQFSGPAAAPAPQFQPAPRDFGSQSGPTAPRYILIQPVAIAPPSAVSPASNSIRAAFPTGLCSRCRRRFTCRSSGCPDLSCPAGCAH